MQRLDVWYQRNIPGNPCIYSIDYGNGTYVAVGQGIFTSSDGVTWFSRFPGDQGPIFDITFYGTRFVAITGDFRPDPDWPSCVDQFLCSLLSTDNGLTWKRGLVSPEAFSTTAVASMQGICVGVGSAIQTSKDQGQSWQVTRPQAWLTAFLDVCVGRDAAGHDVFVAVGDCGFGDPADSLYSAVSSDGLKWEVNASGCVGYLRSIAFGNGFFVAIGSNRRFYTSRDGLNWTGRAYQPPDDLFKIAFGQNTFVAVGANGNVYDSLDGDSWNSRNIGTTEALREVHCCGDTFVVVAENGTIFQSERYDQPFLGLVFDGYGSVSVHPTGVRPMSNWGSTFPKGTVVTLDAHGEYFVRWVTDPFGHKIPIRTPIRTMFAGWSGLNLHNHSPLIRDKENPISITMDSDKQIMTHFSIARPKPPKPPKPPLH